MNEPTIVIREAYRREREAASYGIMDLEKMLEFLAHQGVIWMLEGMPDLSKGEEVLIRHFLTNYRQHQEYDNLEPLDIFSCSASETLVPVSLTPSSTEPQFNTPPNNL